MPDGQGEFAGCVTRFQDITGQSSLEVARLLGFNPGALRAGYIVWRLDEKVEPGELEVQRIRLNVRTGPAQIVKVKAKVSKHTKDYPDSEVRTVRQWNLLKLKQFVEVANVAPGESCPPLSQLKR